LTLGIRFQRISAVLDQQVERAGDVGLGRKHQRRAPGDRLAVAAVGIRAEAQQKRHDLRELFDRVPADMRTRGPQGTQ
jgi:hypothetical protein